jgi:hypothetical protein
MNTFLKARIEQSIQNVIDDNCEDPEWDGWFPPTLVKQMTNAAEIVFDSAFDSQKFAKYQEE